ncbi:MAG: ABC transporter ATP-binding protein [Acidimicrobiia bacterium]|nr:ABC transporter ATP-binding protein [Acidimicrobiia bacterium]
MAEIVLSGVSFTRSGQTVLADIDVVVPSGVLTAIVGPSGSGKSTMLRIIAGLESPTSGTVRVGGQPVEGSPAPGLAMVFEGDSLYDHLDVGGNLELPGRLRHERPPMVTETARRAAKQGRVLGLWRRKPASLSGGERGMVAFARSVARSGLRVLLLDEPLSRADAHARRQFRLDLRELHRETGLTTVVATNDQMEAMSLADQLIVLIGGRIAQVGSPREVFGDPASIEVASFVGRLPMNLFPAQVVEEGGRRWLAVGADRLDLQSAIGLDAGARVIVGIHPHELLRAEPGTPFGRVLRVTVSQIQDLGSTTEIRFGLGSAPAGTYVMTDNQPPVEAVGDRLELTWVPGRLRLFEAGSGRAIPM